MAHKKSGGSTSLGRDSAAKRLGVKVHDGQFIRNGSIIIRQRGSKYRPGKNVSQGKDDTLYATSDGLVKFKTRKIKLFDGSLLPAKLVNVEPK